MEETDRCRFSNLSIRARNSRGADGNRDSFKPGISSCDCGSQFIRNGSNILGLALVNVNNYATSKKDRESCYYQVLGSIAKSSNVGEERVVSNCHVDRRDAALVAKVPILRTR